jgi:hypothetical protein
MAQVFLLYTLDTQEAQQEITALGGRITQKFTDTVIVASLPDSVDPQKLSQSTTKQPNSLDIVSQLAVNSWNKLQLKESSERSIDAAEGLSWDAPGYLPPQFAENDHDSIIRSVSPEDDDPPQESTGTPTSRYMIGSIAVGIIIVSGTRSDLAFSVAEQEKIVQEVQEGLNFLANAEPRANITFTYDIRLITVSSEPGSTSDYESAESPWRNAALQQMGFQANRSGSSDYVQNLKQNKRTDWAYVGYFTKYPLKHFAYAISEKVCMNYSNDGWGPDRINQVFAHESCHIFGAADEYGSCTCGGNHGHLGVPNNNCINCAGSHVPCLMEGNVLQLCQWSRGQIGWDDRLLGPTWHRYELTQASAASNSGAITSVSRIPNSMELWWIGANGSVQAAYWYEGGNWQRYELVPASSASRNGAITSVSRISNSMELWWIGANGSVQAAYWYEGGNWQRYELASAGSASRNSAITSVSRISNSMELWWIGANGSVQAAYWYEGGNWQRYELAPAGSASTTSGVTSVSRISNSMELWWIGANGSVQAAYWYEGGNWQRYELAPAGSASTTSAVTVVSRIPGSMEVWWIGANGSIQAAYWYEGGNWQRYELAPAGSASTTGAVTVVSRIPGSMEVWWIGANGSIQSAYWYG